MNLKMLQLFSSSTYCLLQCLAEIRFMGNRLDVLGVTLSTTLLVSQEYYYGDVHRLLVSNRGIL